MCRKSESVPMNETVSSATMKKSCKPAMLWRVWQASRRALNLEYSPAHQFACCQWQRGRQTPTSYIIYRWIVFLTIVSIGITSFACQKLTRKYKGPKVELNYFKWFIYLTNWGYMLIAVQAGLGLLVLHLFRADKTLSIPCEEDETTMSQSRRTRTPLLCRLYWLTHNVATDLAFVISLVYWTLVYDPKINDINALNLLVHGGNSIIMLCELALTSHPIRMAHALYGVGAGFIYGIFSAFYWAVGGTDRYGLPAIYPALDWNKPGSAFGFVAMCAVVLVFAHCVATCLAALRTHFALRLSAKRAHCDRLTLPTR